ncbi:DNA primase [Nosocomiicoccus ampullae]|uniref:DNA primase n=1 Tax=Nosocomiicoccus ampullae TaxID=489910 RepID=UPI00254AFC6C|nr:DNA primase [Nosocomiicoccus ampullae]MDK6862602.1 DNA primase [Nosocomiicoccus ampullae]
MAEKSVVDQVKESTDIVNLISEYVDLEKRGNNYVGLCPFHNEKTPSFNVYKDTGSYYCFGCRANGSVIDFYMEMENLPFNEALQSLGERSGIKVKHKQTNVNSKELQLIKMHEIMVDNYHNILVSTAEGKEALNYLLKRGFTLEQIKKEKIGFAPNIKDSAIQLLENLKFSKEMMYQAGLVARNEETFEYFDRFRNRIMIPIKNHKGKYVAFTARALGDDTPKYLNSPETDIFHKSSIIFNLSDAYKVIQDEKEVILMEGHMDVLKVKNTSIKNVVATMGTSVSLKQIEILKRVSKNITLMFDGDEAGKNATQSVGEKILEQKGNPYVIPLQTGMDPDEFIEKHGEESFEKYIYENRDHFIVYDAKEKLKSSKRNDLKFSEYLNHSIQLLKYIDNEVERSRLVKQISELYEVDAELIHRQLPKKQRRRGNKTTFSSPSVTRVTSREFKEKHIMHTLINSKERMRYFTSNFDLNLFQTNGYHDIINKLVEYFSEFDTFDKQMFISYIDPELITCLEHIIATDLPVLEEQELNDYIQAICGISSSRGEKNNLIKEIEQAELIGDDERALELFNQLIELQKFPKSK